MKNCSFKDCLRGPAAGIESHWLNLGLLIPRLYAGFALAFAHGSGKLPPSEGFIAGVTSLGFPMPVFFAWCAALAEALGGFLMAIGLLTRPASAFVAFTMLVAALGVHSADPFQKKELSLMYFSISMLYLLAGAGKFSLDGILCRRGAQPLDTQNKV